MSFKDHFSTNSRGYATYRPTYPGQLVDFLGEQAPATELALDCGCGTGQLSTLLARRFHRVLATDASATQIAQAEPRAGVEYRTALAHQSGLPSESVDLATVAQAAHWLDLPAFYAEVRRIGRPRSIVCLITYGVLHVEGPGDEVVQRFYYETLERYWPPERRHVEDGYRNLPFPFEEVAAPPLAIEMSWRLSDLMGYVNTWSAVHELDKAGGRGLIDEFAAELAASWGAPESRRLVRWPLSLRTGRVV